MEGLMIRLNGRMTKFYMSYMIIATLAITVMTIFTYFTAKFDEEKEFIKKGNDNINLISHNGEYILSSYENLSFKISSSKQLNVLANNNGGAYDYLVLKNEFDTYCYPYGTLNSIYVYFKKFYKTFTTSEGMFHIDEFYDRNLFISLNKENITRKIIGRAIAANYFVNKPTNVISFLRYFPINATESSGILVLNLDEQYFFNELSKYKYEGAKTIIVDSENNIISSDDKALLGVSLKNMSINTSEISEKTSGRIIKINNQKYFVFVKQSNVGNLSYMNLVPSLSFYSKLTAIRMRVAKLFIWVLILSSIVGYILAKIMHNPLKKIMTLATEYIKSMGENYSSEDEYIAVSKTMEKLIRDNNDAKLNLVRYKPILREKFLSDILFQNINELDEFNKGLQYCNLIFKHDAFISAIAVDIDSYAAEKDDFNLELKIYTRSIVEAEFSKSSIDAYGLLLDEHNLAFILNFDSSISENELRETLINISESINNILNKDIKVKLFFSFGSMCSNLKNIALSFNQGRKNLNYRAVSDGNYFIFTYKQGEAPQYPIYIQKQILNGVRSGDRSIIQDAVNNFFTEYVHGPDHTKEKLYQIVVVLLSSIYGELIKESDNTAIFSEVNTLSLIKNCSSSSALKNYILESLYRVLEKLNKTSDISSEGLYIDRVVGYIGDNYMKDISLSDISGFVALNPKYLAKIFKECTGKTVNEYLTLHRINISKSLFKDPALTIKDISRMIGYNDVHSFIRFFKKYEGVTPGEYRDL
jgi:two-component system, response regulator YesN